MTLPSIRICTWVTGAPCCGSAAQPVIRIWSDWPTTLTPVVESTALSTVPMGGFAITVPETATDCVDEFWFRLLSVRLTDSLRSELAPVTLASSGEKLMLNVQDSPEARAEDDVQSVFGPAASGKSLA